MQLKLQEASLLEMGLGGLSQDNTLKVRGSTCLSLDFPSNSTLPFNSTAAAAVFLGFFFFSLLLETFCSKSDDGF